MVKSRIKLKQIYISKGGLQTEEYMLDPRETNSLLVNCHLTYCLDRNHAQTLVKPPVGKKRNNLLQYIVRVFLLHGLADIEPKETHGKDRCDSHQRCPHALVESTESLDGKSGKKHLQLCNPLHGAMEYNLQVFQCLPFS